MLHFTTSVGTNEEIEPVCLVTPGQFIDAGDNTNIEVSDEEEKFEDTSGDLDEDNNDEFILSDGASGSETGESYTPEEALALEMYRQIEIKRDGPNFDQELWDRCAGQKTKNEMYDYGVTRDPKLLRAASRGSSSTFNSYTPGVPSNEAKQLKEMIESMKQMQESEKLEREVREAARERELEKQRLELEAVRRDMQEQVKAFTELMRTYPPLPS
ncbi:hypothetical protein L6452_25847 [Arctium lappa]|uniref:Uncharacterized protein n=1 Tax=Arctium lappa TaxID=4217 RepID=A0ACB9ACL6_ARCLA|nr:hypothetical protein L6452_25847 [Arctium lappa]